MSDADLFYRFGIATACSELRRRIWPAVTAILGCGLALAVL